MINKDTPDKLAEIIQDTWPNLYRPPIDYRPPACGLDRPSILPYTGQVNSQSSNINGRTSN
jgi:hypothetical protein